MTRVEAYHILGDLWYEATSKEKEAINIAQDAVQFVDLMPKDMISVVRCKDCKHRRFTGVAPFMYHCCGHNDGLVGKVNDDDFCSYGERKDGES